MSPRALRYTQFVSAAVIARVVLGLGFPLLARLKHRDESVAESLGEIVRYFEPPWQAFELLPFVLLGVVCGSLSHRARALWLFSIALLAFAAIHYVGYMSSEAFMQRRAWTAASLAAGFVPMKCLGVVLVAFLARLILGRLPGPTTA